MDQETTPSKSSAGKTHWYAIQTVSNQETKVKQYIERLIDVEGMGAYIDEVLMPTEKVTEVKSGRKSVRIRKFYPGYVFVKMRLYDDEGKLLQEPWYFIKGIQGVINFVGGDSPVPLKQKEIERILNQVQEVEGKEVPKVLYEIGENVKITDGPFLNLVGTIEEVDTERGKLKISVSIFGRFTPVELEYWQVQRADS